RACSWSRTASRSRTTGSRATPAGYSRGKTRRSACHGAQRKGPPAHWWVAPSGGGLAHEGGAQVLQRLRHVRVSVAGLADRVVELGNDGPVVGVAVGQLLRLGQVLTHLGQCVSGQVTGPFGLVHPCTQIGRASCRERGAV